MLRPLLKARFRLRPLTPGQFLSGRYAWTFKHLRDPTLPDGVQVEQWVRLLTQQQVAVGLGWIAFESLHERAYAKKTHKRPVWKEVMRQPKWLKDLNRDTVKGSK